MISAQCDELRERATTLRQGRWSDGGDDATLMERAADTIWELRNKLADTVDQSEEIERLKAENTKLRELVRMAWKCAHSGPSCSDCRMVAGGCTLQSAMRELGIEAR